MKPYTKSQDATLLLLRLVIASIFLYAGYAKLTFWSGVPEGMPVSDNMLILIKFLSIVEPLGALALVAGFLTRWAAAGLAVIMVGAIFMLQFTMGVNYFTGQTGTGWDYNMLLLTGSVALVAFGAGSWSIDAIWRKK